MAFGSIPFLRKFSEKELVAFFSAIASGLLTLGKLIIGLLTGSLGILSEALHSFLDLLATLMTFFAVSASERPADTEHPYGHGKIENISALAETLLLLLTVAWIMYEASKRIILNEHHVQVTIWSFLIVITAIIVDAERSIQLYRAARKHDSQALRADAMHFSTDILSSTVVLFGLIFTYFGYPMADAFAAIGVSLIVLWISIQLGKENIDELIDKAPEGMQERIQVAINPIKGIRKINRIRVRKSGSTTFVDITLTMEPELPLSVVTQVIEQVNSQVKTIVGNDSDVLVHVESLEQKQFMEVITKITELLTKEPIIKSSHDMFIYNTDDGNYLLTHLEVLPSLELQSLEQKTKQLQNTIKQEFPWLTEIIFHVEPYVGERYSTFDSKIVDKELRRLVNENKFLNRISSYTTFSITENHYSLFLKVTANPEHKVRRVHKATTELEDMIKELFPFFTQVIIEYNAETRINN